MDTKPDSVEAIWDKLAKEFRNWNGVKPRWSWVRTGLSERAGYKRLRILEGGEQAKVYFSLTKTLSGRELSYLHKRSLANFEQAQAAARSATIMNLTIFIGALVIFNQIFPGMIAKVALTLMQSNDSLGVWLAVITTAMFLIMVIGVLSYSYGGTAQARDLKHLLELSLARRALKDDNVSASSDDGGIGSDLRENFITDI